MTDHRMIAGSHERPGGPECRCGAAWSRWNDACIMQLAPPQIRVFPLHSIELRTSDDEGRQIILSASAWFRMAASFARSAENGAGHPTVVAYYDRLSHEALLIARLKQHLALRRIRDRA